MINAGKSDEAMDERKRFTGKEDFRAAGFIVNLDCALENSEKVGRKIAGSAVNAVFSIPFLRRACLNFVEVKW